MSDIAFAVCGGIVLGIVFFGGLLWTVKKGLGVSHPTLFFFFSYVLRTCIVASGLYWVASDRWQHLAAAFAGFLLIRWVCTSFSRTGGGYESEP
jgi:F1F0 ATPase subunit 2